MKVELVEDVASAERLIADEDELLIRVSKGMKRTHIDKAPNRIFKKHIEFEKGRQTGNPNRSIARYSLSKTISIDSLQTAFAVYDLTEWHSETLLKYFFLNSLPYSKRRTNALLNPLANL